MKILWSVALTISFATCSSLPTSSNHAMGEPYDSEWAIAQRRLICLGYHADRVPPTSVGWESRDGSFFCGDIEANGCYIPEKRLIIWNTQTPNVIRHEAGHAILHRLLGSNLDWHCYEHGNDGIDDGKEDWCPKELLFPQDYGC